LASPLSATPAGRDRCVRAEVDGRGPSAGRSSVMDASHRATGWRPTWKGCETLGTWSSPPCTASAGPAPDRRADLALCWPPRRAALASWWWPAARASDRRGSSSVPRTACDRRRRSGGGWWRATENSDDVRHGRPGHLSPGRTAAASARACGLATRTPRAGPPTSRMNPAAPQRSANPDLRGRRLKAGREHARLRVGADGRGTTGC